MHSVAIISAIIKFIILYALPNIYKNIIDQLNNGLLVENPFILG